jgi:hypothetical protein
VWNQNLDTHCIALILMLAAACGGVASAPADAASVEAGDTSVAPPQDASTSSDSASDSATGGGADEPDALDASAALDAVDDFVCPAAYWDSGSACCTAQTSATVCGPPSVVCCDPQRHICSGCGGH